MPNDLQGLRVGLCAYREVSPQTVASLFQLSQALPGVSLAIKAGADCSPARNALAGGTKERYLLFVDSDISFSPEAVAVLGQALQQDPQLGAVSGFYVKWDGTGEPVCGWRDGKEWLNGSKKAERVEKLKESQAVAEVDTFGAGFLLIDTEALKSLKFPYFEGGYRDGRYEGEDTYFCTKLKAAGYKPSVHFGCPVGHTGPTTWGPS